MDQMVKLSALIRHIKDGTLFDRLIHAGTHRRFRKYAEFITSKQPYIEKKLSSRITMRLFRDANLSRELYCYGFEESEMQFLKRYLKPGDCVFDIGANIGLFTLVASELVSTAGRVVSFEPSPRTFEWLQENVVANPCDNVEICRLALSDVEGAIDFYVSNDGFDAFNSIVKPSKGDNYSKVSVPTTTVDAFLSSRPALQPVFIKMDVEGFEIPLLTGAAALLGSAGAPDLMVEFTESNAHNAGTTCAALYEKIVSYGYQLFEYNHRNNSLVAEPAGRTYTRYKNLIATKHPDRVRARLLKRT